MARGDGIDRTSARNAKMTAAKVGNAQAHNERQKEKLCKSRYCPRANADECPFQISIR